MFKLLRNDTDILVISHKYVDELRSVPESKLSSTYAIFRVGPFFHNLRNKLVKCEEGSAKDVYKRAFH
jgi:hypothetical protein